MDSHYCPDIDVLLASGITESGKLLNEVKSASITWPQDSNTYTHTHTHTHTHGNKGFV